MLFMYIHTHAVEKCLVDKLEEASKIVGQVQDATKRAGIKMIGPYIAAHEHTSFTIFDTDDLATLEHALVPLTIWGSGRMIPVTSMEQLLQQ
ncbi:DUF3303 family protein [Chloroflexota bacterium]